MALVNRQNNLFAAEDWKVAYKAYSKVDFQAYDFDTIKDALVDYVRTNFPENFNDYTESSEFIAIIEMLAFLSQSIAFRMDINSRENFLETAERRDSIFKLAKMLGYNPKRNIPASGLMKVTAIRTTENLTDSLGNPLNNVNVFFDDANNPDSYEQFITILNAAMSSSNRYSTPIKTGKVNNINSEIYEIQTPINAPLTFPFKATINGTEMPFEIVNPDFVDGGVFTEMHPELLNNFNIIYRNDGLGVSSNNSGFFLMFKQGTLNKSSLDFNIPVESRTEDITLPNINETDVWLSELDDNGFALNKWARVPNTVGQTLTYNDVVLKNRNLYAVENLDNDSIRLKFPDGTFGNIPFGNFRLYTRSSANSTFTIHPQDLRNISIDIPYENADGELHALTITASLKYAVKNSLPTETLAAIKQRAPQAFYTQNRMTSSQDYNVFPFSQSSNITKLKAINRTHAGHSRYIDINDPTGTYQNLDTFAQDGALYTEVNTKSSAIRISNNNTVQEVLQFDVPQILKDDSMNNFMYNEFRKQWESTNSNIFSIRSLSIYWKSLPVVTGTSRTGYFTETSSTPGTENVLVNYYFLYKMFQENNFIKFENPNDPSDYVWARIVTIENNGQLHSGLSTATGPFYLSTAIKHGWQATDFISTMRKEFLLPERNAIIEKLQEKTKFGLGYNVLTNQWYTISSNNLDTTSDFSPLFAQDQTDLNKDSSWLLKFDLVTAPNSFGGTEYNITYRVQDYIVESKNDLKFYNINNAKVADSLNSASQDLITFTTLNFKPGSAETFTWSDTTGNDIGDQFVSNETGSSYAPSSWNPDIPLRSRSTQWFDVNVGWKTNLGIFIGGDVAGNIFVDPTTINLNTYVENPLDLSNIENTSNINIGNNTGSINYWPGYVTFAFSNTTFGVNNILAGNGEVIYKDLNPDTGAFEVYHANTTITISHGINDDTPNVSAIGRVKLLDSDTITEKGNLKITGWNSNNHTHVRDAKGLSRDQLIVNYKFDKEKLTNDIKWTVTKPVKYNDGYTDNRKVFVKAYDTDNDLVPDRPLQFEEFVGYNDLVFFDYYTDFDGYSYSRPFTGNILDLRDESVIKVDLSDQTVTPGSYTNISDLTKINLIIIKDDSMVKDFENSDGQLSGLLLYSVASDTIFRLSSSSSDINTVVGLAQTEDQIYVRNGRAAGQNNSALTNDEVIFKWKHVAPKDVRIDPSVSNVVEMLILTTTYYDAIQVYKKVPGTEFPYPPTSSELANEFANLNEFKNASDTLVFKSAKFKKLFGEDAEEEVQAKFRVVKLKGSTLSDNEIKSKIIKAFDAYFAVTNWEFGETFYFTELSSYVHQQLGSNIGSIVIIPRNTAGTFGDLFQVKGEPNELFLNTATVNDIEVVEKISSQTLRSDR